LCSLPTYISAISRRSVCCLFLYDLIEFQRRIAVSKIKAATKSTIDGNYEFVVHVKKEYDYRFVNEQ
jgi:hypothetical protein